MKNTIQFIRDYGNLTELAGYAEVHRTMLYQILNGNRYPGIKTLRGLHRAGMRKEDIVEDIFKEG